MLNRYQVLLTDWLAEHMKLIAKKNDLSFSEMIRIVLCEGLLHSAPIIYSEYKPRVNKKLLADLAKEGSNTKTPMERKHQLSSKLYFETRKVLEYLNGKLIKEIKNSLPNKRN